MIMSFVFSGANMAVAVKNLRQVKIYKKDS